MATREAYKLFDGSEGNLKFFYDNEGSAIVFLVAMSNEEIFS
jgi:hypothetical protein